MVKLGGKSRRQFLRAMGGSVLALTLLSCTKKSGQRKPNFIIIFCDDLGYGDLGCYGSKKHRTPNIDKMAAEGVKFTDFYVSSPFCTPSRASLMTGCYPRRVSMDTDSQGNCVVFPVAQKGLHPDEITIADLLKAKDYATACIGKWHLGDQPEFLPTKQGFDYYFGLPYSNDTGMNGVKPPNVKREYPPLPLLRNETVIEAPVNQATLTKRYTEEAIQFIQRNQKSPFFLYLPHTMPHKPVHSSKDFHGRSANKGYGDAVEEIDWSTAEILKTLKELGLHKNTLVLFTSDNGASKWVRDGRGDNLPLSGWKGETLEGGMREPFIAYWPGKIPSGTGCKELATTMDFLPTLAALAGTTSPADRIIDGKDIWPLLSGQEGAKSPHKVFYYYLRDQLQAVRSGKWKLHLPLQRINKSCWAIENKKRSSALYDLENDIGETLNVADEHPEIVRKLLNLAERARKDLGDKDRLGKNQRPAGIVAKAKPLVFQNSS